jgi:hypothetical protein
VVPFSIRHHSQPKKPLTPFVKPTNVRLYAPNGSLWLRLLLIILHLLHPQAQW